MGDIRLHKFLAESGVASRRRAEELIRQGRVEVNSVKVTSMGQKVTEADSVKVDGRVVIPDSKKLYIMINKPVGYVSTAKDQFSRKTVIELVPGIKQRIYPVGRLDYDTSGLLLLTNDGEFTHMLTHPKHEVAKVYTAEIKGAVTKEEIIQFEKGIRIEDYITSPAKLKVLKKSKETSLVEIIIYEGRNRQVRKMCEAIGHPVVSLKRMAIGGIRLGSLPEGQWRYLTAEEVEQLRKKHRL